MIWRFRRRGIMQHASKANLTITPGRHPGLVVAGMAKEGGIPVIVGDIIACSGWACDG
jgi:hypothetical protein